MSKYEIHGDQVFRHYITDDGVQGVHQIPLAAVASRMALLHLDDPGQAVDAILDELELDPGVNLYSPVYEAISKGDPAPLDAHLEALGALCSARCDGRDEAEFKQRLRSEHGEALNEARWQFIAELLGPGASLETGDEQNP